MSKIEWTDKTWNPVTGCTKVSQGCKHCYAERMYERFHGPGSFKNVICHQDRLTIPMHWKKPSMIFVNSMSDLFHEDVPFEFIDAVFSVMSDIDWHIYQVLTKRAERMVEFYKWKHDEFGIPWKPKDNVWLGVSVENQKAMEDRVPLLLQVEATVRFLSCEPLLGPVELPVDYSDGSVCIDWVICGGESGPGARAIHPDWVRSLRDQCARSTVPVPFFFKQWGEFVPHMESKHTTSVIYNGIGYEMAKVGKKKAGRLLDNRLHDAYPLTTTIN
jgi:protein gp37